MLNFIKTFRADEDGAVTVDWVVLTAAIVGLGIAVLGSVRSARRWLGTSRPLGTAVPIVVAMIHDRDYPLPPGGR
jgi:Flp pilus assembly pilin Flp